MTRCKKQPVGAELRVPFGGRDLGPTEISRIRALCVDRPGATYRELATIVCREWDWRRANGELRVQATQNLLHRLHDRGLIELPSPQRRRTKVCRGETAESRSYFSPLPCEVLAKDVFLREVVVRPIRREELSAWEEALLRFHYLRNVRIVGETIRYVAEVNGRWLGVLGWGAAALKSRHREAFVGWDEKTKYQRLHLVANNVRFLVLPWVRVPRLASRILSQNLRRLSLDWEERYDHPILLAETFVDIGRFRGTCYRAANWIYLGETRGVGRHGQGFASHGQKKALYVYPLHRRAVEILAARFPSPEILRRRSMSSQAIDANSLPLEGKGGLIEVLRAITDPRKPKGVRHPIASVLGLAVMAALSGMRSYEAIAEWAQDVPKELLKRLKCWCHRAPSEPTFRRVLQSVNADEIDEKVGRWLMGLTLPKAVALDGKTLRGSRDGERSACHLLSAITHDSGVVVAQEKVDEKSNEIPGARPLLEAIDLKGSTVTADAMHTQKDLARFLVEEKRADYVFVAKENQPTLREDIATLNWESFSPSGADMRQGARPDRGPEDLLKR